MHVGNEHTLSGYYTESGSGRFINVVKPMVSPPAFFIKLYAKNKR